ncbi:ABC transporter substrate-binding protein [Paraburkholderia caribensis]|jgi:phospholipid transport system substrate-binding protein|uniref:Toluene tolerance protein n=2 Tax=Paraburkholderia caribensis TaxID=75105 RepID=A0A9Q6S981_9BURK|nr:toluene tolerance protein [Paraburkholderia caribensis]AMV47543.1 toluene tolerance protein [Paraburkholderia caribensis]AUT56685.1 toluene tolerance protein [Paraburkholderia caribensis]MDR6382554.1 phospholipid transport system substrate-binding protein [Paraburkholderia caribensis]PTB26920.1 ABC transporter substrate-binding protein [Paraburkholderia caribensis]
MNIAHIRSRFFVAVLFLTMLAFGNTVSAQTVDSSDPQILIKSVTQQVLDEVHKQAIDPSDIPRIMDIVNRDILPYIDFEHTTQLALARYWRTATPAQQQQLTQQFKMLLIHLYSGALAQLKPDQKIDYPPMRVAPTDSDAVVRTIASTNAQPVEIDYRLRKTPQGWRVYDLNVMGAWLVQTYRQQFGETIQQSGIDGLLRFLTDRNQQLASGKPQ